MTTVEQAAVPRATAAARLPLTTAISTHAGDARDLSRVVAHLALGRYLARRFPLCLMFALTSWATVFPAEAQDPVPPRGNAPSAGEIALMVRRASEPEVIGAWRRALREGGSRQRAAVARAAHATGAAALANDLMEALQKETDRQAAIEEAAALAGMTAAERDTNLLEAGKRLGDPVLAEVALILAHSRRARAIPAYLDQVKQALVAESDLSDFFSLATIKDGSALAPAAAAALAAGDAEVWLAILDVSIRRDALPETSMLAAALRHASAGISSETAWQLALYFADEPGSPAKELLSRMGTDPAPPGDPAADADLAAGVELLARVLGRAPVEGKAWIAWLEGSEKSRLDEIGTLKTLVTYLTDKERKAMGNRLKRLFPKVDFPEPSRRTSARRSAPAESDERPAIARMANDYPSGYVSEAVAASGCALEGRPAIAIADVAYDDFDRPVRISLRLTPSSSECSDAAVALFASALRPIRDSAGAETRRTLFLVLEKGYLSRLEKPPSADRSVILMQPEISETARVQPPKRVHFVKPVYPISAHRDGKRGKVIVEVVVNREGLISAVELLKQTEEAFVAPTIAAVAQWRYKPAMLGGRPVRVWLTVIVEFNLK